MTTLLKSTGLVLAGVGIGAATVALIGSSAPAFTPTSRMGFASPMTTTAAASTFDASSRRSAYVPRASAPAARRISTTARYREVTIPAGTQLSLRLGNAYSSETSHVEQAVNATVVSGVHANGVTALPAGTRVSGIVSSVERPGRVKGRGEIGLQFNRVTVGGESYPMSASYVRVAPATKKRDATKIAVPAAGGAIIGAILGGKKGALEGAAIGGGAGTAVVLSTRGKDAYIGGGSVIGVTLRRAITVRVPV